MKLQTQKKIAKTFLICLALAVYISIFWIMPLIVFKHTIKDVLFEHLIIFGIVFIIIGAMWSISILDKKEIK